MFVENKSQPNDSGFSDYKDEGQSHFSLYTMGWVLINFGMGMLNPINMAI